MAGMAKNEKHVIGIYLEGDFFYVSHLCKSGKKVQLVDAEFVELAPHKQITPAGAFNEQGDLDFLQDDSDIHFSADIPDQDILLTETDYSSENAKIELIRETLQKYQDKKYLVALTLAEPQVYYSYFTSNWGLSGEKLKRRVIVELTKIRPDAELLTPADLHCIELADGRIMAAARDTEIQLYHLVSGAIPQLNSRMQFVESAELSLVNLVIENYHFLEKEVSLIVYLGNEFSRLIFLQGRQILNVSYIIGVGVDAANINNTIYSRILLEMDNLSLPKVHNIILSGEACESGLKEFLLEMIPEESNIDYLTFQRLEIAGIDSLLARFAVPTGAALRALEPRKDRFYNIDLTPFYLKESRKKLKLGPAGWLLFALIPILTLLITFKFSQQKKELIELRQQEKYSRGELVYLQNMEMRLNTVKQKLSNYENTLGVLDSIPLASHAWSAYLYQVSGAARKVGKVWISDIAPAKDGRVILRGYSIWRNRIPQFVDQVGNAALNKVEMFEIRKKKFYSFEIYAELPDQ